MAAELVAQSGGAASVTGGATGSDGTSVGIAAGGDGGELWHRFGAASGAVGGGGDNNGESTTLGLGIA